LAREQDDLLSNEDLPSLLLGLPAFLEHLGSNVPISEAMADLLRDADKVHGRLAKHDDETIDKLRAIRTEVPADPVDSEEHPAQTAGENLRKFDAVASSKSELHDTPRPDVTDMSTSGKLIRCLAMRIHLTPDPLQTELRARLRTVEGEHEYAFRDYAMRLRAQPGFALRRLQLAARQLNPRPGSSLEPDLFDEHHRNIYAYPPELRKWWQGERPSNSYEAKAVDAAIREDVNSVCRGLTRKLQGQRSREALLEAYRLRCEWYDTRGISELLERLDDERRKEDLLADHLALFLFDAGLRPLTRVMLGRLEPDLFDAPPFQPSFYVEAKQYVDRAGAQKAIEDGPRQIWSTAHRLKAKFDLREAFLVVYRRGGPLLRFEGPATAQGLVLRPVLVDLAPGNQSGSRQRDIIDVSVATLLATS
jgi:hypothetical protein